MPRTPNSPPASALADQLRRAIDDGGLSLSELGRRSSVDHGQLVRFMQGTDIRMQTAGRICAALGLSLAGSVRPRGRPKATPKAHPE